MRRLPLLVLGLLPFALSACGGSSDPLASAPTIAKSSAPAPVTVETKDLIIGKGPTATANSYVAINYVGANYATGKVFDSSWINKKPAHLALASVIPGVRTGMLGMHVGSRRQIIVPASLGYGATGQKPLVAPNETLTFVIDLLSTTKLRPAPTVTGTPGPAPTALKITDETVGTGPKVTSSNTVTVNYAGANYQTGAIFDSSWARSTPAQFMLSGVIPGFKQGLLGMQVGGRRIIVIPSKLGYGSAGQSPAIKPNEPLVFVVDLININ